MFPCEKMGKDNGPPNCKITNYYQLLDTCFAMVDWPKARSS
jgi:hypothetical protein